jgi:para-nitrobenzyl esterase
MRIHLRCLIVLSLALPLAAAIPEPVRVEGGLISGIAGSNPQIRVFMGIPYAAPPLRDLRWREPRAPAPWLGVRKADHFGPACVQDQQLRNSIYWKGDYSVSEDCLYLNVWTPAKSGRDGLPVMVWIHGGAFVEGAGSSLWWNGERLAGRGVVLVTFNYRLGVFGFMAHPELTRTSEHGSSGNYGLLDQIAALSWVKRNISNFGGDPDRVTVFGQSAGGASICYLMASPLAKGLFARAIGQSGSPLFQRLAPQRDAERQGLTAAESLHASSLTDLRDRRTDEIRRLRDGFQPTLDGYVIPREIFETFASGGQNDVPLIAGSMENEAGVNRPPSRESYVAQVRQQYATMAGEILALYPAHTDEEAQASFYALARDQVSAASRAWVLMAAKTGKHHTYWYRFSQAPPVPAGDVFMQGDASRFGAYHGADLIYVFDNLLAGYLNWHWTRADRDVAFAISSYWIQFASAGDPNREALPRWDRFERSDSRFMEFGEKIGMQPVRNSRGLDLIEAIETKPRLRSP